MMEAGGSVSPPSHLTAGRNTHKRAPKTKKKLPDGSASAYPPSLWKRFIAKLFRKNASSSPCSPSRADVVAAVADEIQREKLLHQLLGDEFNDWLRSLDELCDWAAGLVGRPERGHVDVPAAPTVVRECTLSFAHFRSDREYAQYWLLLIIVTHVHERFWVLFHPGASEQANRDAATQYREALREGPQSSVGAVRCALYQSFQGTMSEDLVRNIAASVVQQWGSAIQPRLGSVEIPPSLTDRVARIVHDAYVWSAEIKGKVAKENYDLFVVRPFAAWDGERMEWYGQRNAVPPAGSVVSALVSPGILSRISALDSHVQKKAQVLLCQCAKPCPASSPAPAVGTKRTGDVPITPSSANIPSATPRHRRGRTLRTRLGSIFVR